MDDFDFHDTFSLAAQAHLLSDPDPGPRRGAKGSYGAFVLFLLASCALLFLLTS